MQLKKNIPGMEHRPIGLMQSSVGGTVIEEWMSTSALEACLPAADSVSHAACSAGSQQNSELYYRMVEPLAPMSLTGALWYQGESNVAQNWKPTNKTWPFNE
jgi:sialate O-acetylesterase